MSFLTPSTWLLRQIVLGQSSHCLGLPIGQRFSLAIVWSDSSPRDSPPTWTWLFKNMAFGDRSQVFMVLLQAFSSYAVFSIPGSIFNFSNNVSWRISKPLIPLREALPERIIPFKKVWQDCLPYPFLRRVMMYIYVLKGLVNLKQINKFTTIKKIVYKFIWWQACPLLFCTAGSWTS